MVKKILLLLLFSVAFIFSTPIVRAEGEFETSYNVTYSIETTGITTVTEKITLRNLTDRYYASSFNLSISSTELTEVVAFDDKGSLEVSQEKNDRNSQINVKFKEQNAGRDKEYRFNIRFKSKDFAEKQGKVWQVSVPKIASLKNLNNFSLTLSVPESFGDPTSILPEPKSYASSGGKLNYFFTKEQLLESGILANFGSFQLFDYSLKFHLSNKGLLPAIAKLPLPPDTEYQQVLINNIEPRPENVVLDKDGNYIGFFKLDGKTDLEVKVAGIAKIVMNPLDKKTLTAEQIAEYTSSKQYWDKDNPVIKTKLNEIFKDGTPKTNTEKAHLINKFVVNSLTYNEERIASEDFERLGALAVLNNPDQALCSEYTDLFITLSRAAMIPARMNTGFAYTANKSLRPVSLDDLLHAWPEYYDPAKGWVMIDPTWENTTGGVNYFSRFDLNHLVLAKRGASSTEPITADTVEVKFSGGEFKQITRIGVDIEAPKEMVSGLPVKTKIKLSNTGNTTYPEFNGIFSSSKLGFSIEGGDYVLTQEVRNPSMPPFALRELNLRLKTRYLWDSYEDILQVNFGDQDIEKKILVKPFFNYKLFPIAIAGAITLMILLYISLFGIHLFHFKKTSNK